MNEANEDFKLPFVLTKKHGGEYDTASFSAGWHLGILEARLSLASTAGLVVPPVLLKTAWRQQCDLLAMSHGLLLKVEIADEDPDYAFYTFATAEFFRSDDD